MIYELRRKEKKKKEYHVSKQYVKLINFKFLKNSFYLNLIALF